MLGFIFHTWSIWVQLDLQTNNRCKMLLSVVVHLLAQDCDVASIERQPGQVRIHSSHSRVPANTNRIHQLPVAVKTHPHHLGDLDDLHLEADLVNINYFI